MLEIVNNICFLMLAGILNYDFYKRDGKLSPLLIASIICMTALAVCIIIRIISYL